MIFVINNLKYDTDKMELVSEKCKYLYSNTGIPRIMYHGKNVKLWRSNKGNWLITYGKDYTRNYADALSEKEAKTYLISYDIAAYEKIFGEIEEA